MPLPVTDTRAAFRPLSREIVDLLRSLDADDWERSTVAGTWQVRDVVAHLVDTALRRLSFHRDRMPPRGDTSRGTTDRDLAAFINQLNASWVLAAGRLSARVLTDLYFRSSTDLADFVETLDLYADAFFPVSWAGGHASAQWLDIGREFTEVWHHGAQIREAVGAGAFSDSRWLQAVLRIAMHALPHAYRDVPARPGLAVAIHVTGRSPGSWTLRTHGGAWDVEEGLPPRATVTATIGDEIAWRVLFNALPLSKARSLVHLEGDDSLALPLLAARAVIV